MRADYSARFLCYRCRMNSLVETSCELAYVHSRISTWKTVLHTVLLCFTAISFYLALNFVVVPEVNRTFSIWTRSISNDVNLRIKSSDYNVCNSPACQMAARAIIRSLSHDSDPCVDFYHFVCSRWIKEHPLAPTRHKTSADHIAVERSLRTLKTILKEPSSAPSMNFLFDNCKRGDDSLFSALVNTVLYTTGLENWPYMPDSPKSLTKEDVSYRIGSVYRELGLDSLFQFGEEQDVSDQNTRLLSIDHPRFLGGTSIQEAVDRDDGSLTIAFRTLMDMVDKSEKVNIGGVERNIHVLYESPVNKCFATSNCDVIRFSDLPALEFINWTALLFGVTGTHEDPKYRKIKVKSPKYLLNLFKGFEPEMADVLNYLVFRIMMSVFPLMNSKKHFNILAQWVTQKDPEPPLGSDKEDQCLRFMNDFEPFVPMMLVGDVKAQELSQKLRDDIRRKVPAGFIRYIQQNLPISPDTYNTVTKQVRQIAWEFFYPAYLEDPHNLKRYYEGIYTNNPRSPIVYFYYYYIKNSVQKRRSFFAQDGQKASWTVNLFSSWPRFDPPYRTFEVPVAAFDHDLPNDATLNLFQLAKVAFRVFHGLFRYLHDFVSKRSHRGTASITAKSINRCHECIAKQYRRLFPNTTTEDTIISDVLDVFSLRAALNLFRTEVVQQGGDVRLQGAASYSSDQLFFIRYALSFCENLSAAYVEKRMTMGRERPAWLRVNAVLRNIPEFSQAFRCNSSDFMNEKKPCVP